MDQLHLNVRNTASSVALYKQGRQRDLGRGFRSKKLQAPPKCRIVEPSVPFNLLTPTTVLSNVTFNEDLKVKFHEEHPELRQLALVIINNISPRALVIYTDGSKSDSGRTGSEIFMKTSTGEFRYRFRNRTTAQYSAQN
ncbi:uncharacterized protein CEXT_554791 [Caerostris extrusa]|uniref:LAGLIDADG homing endonuclease n=1 Tax=Caerostris extrusa TaxID=172846 RepID=A0AAV4YDP7_CAEEX|nr:uncharacterized protein CEXT_554791 [Caerostris extrusa]